MPPEPIPTTNPASNGRTRTPGAVLLLSCYESGHQPLGLAWPAAFLRAAGFSPVSQDLALERLSPEAVRAAALVAISVPMHTALVLGVRVARRVRELNPACHIAFHGLYAALNGPHLPPGVADTVLGAEAEPELVALAQALAAGTEKAAGHARTNAPRPPGRVAFVPPDRQALPPLARYAQLLPAGGAEPVAAGYVEASRGCKHRCLHCPLVPVYRGRFFAVPRDQVLADVERLVAGGAGHITFGDPDFLNGPGHALALVRALHARFPGVGYDVTTKVEHLLRHRALLPELAATGCRFVVSAVESLSDAVLTALDKGHTRADVEEALALTRRAGLVLRPTLLPFTPWAGLPDYLELLEFVAAEGLVHQVEPVQFSLRLLVPPGSALLDTPQFAPFQGAPDAEAFTCRWRHPDPRMDALQARVAGIVEAATADGLPPEDTFRAILAAALEAAGQPDRLTPLLAAAPPAPPAPRLSEPWFC